MQFEKEITVKTFRDFEKQEFKPKIVTFTEFEELPPGIVEKLDELYNLGDAISQGSVHEYLQFDYETGGSCYIFPETEISEPHTYIIDVENGEVTGYLVIELDGEKNPQVAETETFMNENARQKQGRGTRRLWIAKKVALQYYNQPLHSGVHRDVVPQRMWENLQREGFAELLGVNADGEKRWKMVS
jgi:hypothetical protein